MIGTHALVFDTNTFGRITARNNDILFSNLFTNFNKLFNPDKKFSDFMSVLTPHLLLEYLGVVPPDFSLYFSNKDELENDTIALIYTEALKVYQNTHNLSAKYLCHRNSENLKRVSGTAKRLYRDVVDGELAIKGFEDRIHRNLALDFLYRFPHKAKQYSIPDDKILQIHYNTIIDIYAFHKEKNNGCQTRGIINLAEDLKMRMSMPMDFESKKILEATKGIKKFQDLADLDLIQISCLGVFVTDKKYPAAIFTEDKKE